MRLTLPDGTVVSSEGPTWPRPSPGTRPGGPVCACEGAAESSSATAEEYWPDMEGLDYRDTVTDWELPPGTFFDLAVVHVLTTATLDRLRELYRQGRFEFRRFRPTIVVASEGAGFIENEWVGHTLAIGDEVRLQITGRCPRCVMTTLAQADRRTIRASYVLLRRQRSERGRLRRRHFGGRCPPRRCGHGERQRTRPRGMPPDVLRHVPRQQRLPVSTPAPQIF